MKAGKELDEKIAREILGLEQNSNSPHLWRDPAIKSSPFVYLHEYSTDIASAWEVVESFRGTPWRFHIEQTESEEWTVVISHPNDGQSVTAHAKTPQEAICLAAVKTKDYK